MMIDNKVVCSEKAKCCGSTEGRTAGQVVHVKILVVTREIPVLIMNHVGTEEKAEERGQVGRHGTLLQGLFWCHYPLKSGQVIINVCTNTHTHTERQGASLFLRVLTGTVSKSQL